MAAPQFPQAQPGAPAAPTIPGVLPTAQPPSTLDAARASLVAGGHPTAPGAGVPTFASQVAAARGGAAPAPFAQPPQAPAAQPPGVVPIAAHPQFRLYSHEEMAAPQAPAVPTPGYAPPLAPPVPAVDPSIVALLTGVSASNAKMATAIDRLTRPGAQAPTAPPDPGPMPNAMLEPDKFGKWLEARDARMAYTLEQKLAPQQPQVSQEQREEAQRAEQEFRAVTTPLFQELFTTYPALERADRAALSAVVNSTAVEMGLNSMEALRYVASSPQHRQAVFARIAARLGVSPAAQYGAAPAAAPFVPPHAGGFLGAPQPAPAAYAPQPAAPQYAVWNGQQWVPVAAPAPMGPVVDRTFGASGGSMLPAPGPTQAPAAQIPSLGAQIAEVQQRAGIYGR